MAGNWNPNSPRVVGPEWRGFATVLDKATKSPFKAMRFESHVAETINTVEVGLGTNLNATAPLFRLLEIYPEADVLLGESIGVDRFVPNAHGTGTGIGNWQNQAGSTTNIHLSIDDAVRYPPIGTDYIRCRTGGPGTFASFHMSSGAFPLTRRVGRLRVRFVAGSSQGWRTIRFRLYHVPSGTFYAPPGADRNYHIYGTLVELDLGEINPQTLLPWNANDVRTFAGPGNIWQLRWASAGSIASEARIFNAELEVQWRSAENRVALGTWERPIGAHIGPGATVGFDHRNKFVPLDQFVTPTGAGSWTPGWLKPASGAFIVVFRNALDTMIGGATPRAQDIFWSFTAGRDRNGAVAPPVPGMRSGPVVFGAASTALHGGIFSAGPFTEPMAPGLAFVRSDTITSDDSQPYVVQFNRFQTELADIGDTFDWAQAFTAPATDTYLGVRTVVRCPINTNGTPDTTAKLLITVHSWDGVSPTPATDPQIGGSLELSAADLLADTTVTGLPGYGISGGPVRHLWRDVRDFLSSAAALTSGTHYYIRFRKTAGRPGTVWGLVQLATLGSGAVDHSEATFQGADPNGFVIRYNRSTNVDDGFGNRDLGVQLLEAPDPPLNLRHELRSKLVSAQFGPCDPIEQYYSRLDWDDPGTYTQFQQWDIERLDPPTLTTPETWNRVGTSVEEALCDFEDHEATRDRPTRYRVRARTIDGGFSEWVETAGTTPPSVGPHLLLTSNAKPALNVGTGFEPAVGYEFPDHDSDELIRLSGVAYQAGFIDAIDRGVIGNYRLIVNFKVPPADGDGNPIGGETMFLPVRRMIRSDFMAEQLLPYVCVLDHEGNRRFAYVRLSRGERLQPGHRYYAEAAVVPLTGLPSSIERSALPSTALALDGTTDGMSTPNVADFQIVGDLEARWEAEFTNAFLPAAQTIASKWEPTGNQRSYLVQHIATSGRPRIIWSPDGTSTNQVIVSANADPPWSLSNRLAFKLEFDVNNGGSYNIRFYWALRHGGPYTQLGTQLTGAATSIFNSSAPYRIGVFGTAGTEPFTGNIFNVDLYAGFGLAAVRRSGLNFRSRPLGVPAITDYNGHAFSYLGDAHIVEVEGTPLAA